MRRLLLVTTCAVGLLVPAAPAAAETVQTRDREGRTITFDVQAAGANVEWYAEILRGALHSDEIQRVTIRIVDAEALARTCGAEALACYGGRRGIGTIIVPVGESQSLAETLLHEYGHHIDASRSVPGVREPNGTPGWWAARAVAARLQTGEVAQDYSLGWDRSVAEIFAEDYVQVHTTGHYAIRWLTPPDDAVKQAIIADLGGTAPVAPPVSPSPEPETPQAVTITRSGLIARGRSSYVPFALLGPGRRVELAVRATTRGARVRVELVCNGTLVERRTISGARRAAIDRSGLGPAECDVVLRNTGTRAVGVVLSLRLSRPGV